MVSFQAPPTAADGITIVSAGGVLSAVQNIILGAGNVLPTGSATSYVAPFGDTPASAEEDCECPPPYVGTKTVRLLATNPKNIVSDGATLTLRKTGGATALTVTWAAAAPKNTLKDISAAITFAATDRYCLEFVAPAGSPVRMSWGLFTT